MTIFCGGKWQNFKLDIGQIAHLANLEIWRKPLGENSKNNLLRFNNQKLSQNSPKSQTPQLPYNSQPHKTVFLSR